MVPIANGYGVWLSSSSPEISSFYVLLMSDVLRPMSDVYKRRGYRVVVKLPGSDNQMHADRK